MLRVGGLIPYSQNFISDPSLIKRLLKQSDISVSDIVLDIGAGKGVLTQQLIPVSKKVIAIEIDPSLFKCLYSKYSSVPNVQLVNNDFLKISLPHDSFKVFSNIPFNYTSRIMDKLYFQGSTPTSAYIIMQREASNIYLGLPRETQKSLLLKPLFDISIFHSFKKTDFVPTPQVDADMIHIKKLVSPYIEIDSIEKYFDFVVFGTTQYKTTLKKSLSKIFTHEQFKRLATSLEFSLETKPLDLSFKQWVGLFNYYQHGVLETKKILVKNSYLKQKATQQNLKKVYRTRKFGNPTLHHL